MSLVRPFLAVLLLGIPGAGSFMTVSATLPSQTTDAALLEFCARLDELGARTEHPRNPESLVQEFQPGKDVNSRDWPRQNGWVAWGFDTNAEHGTRLRIGLRELREDRFHAHGTFVAAGPQRFVVLLPVGKWDRFVLLEEKSRKWSVAKDEPIGKEPAFAGFDEGWLHALREGGWASTASEVLGQFQARYVSTRTVNQVVHSANGAGTEALARALDFERQGESVPIKLLNHERWFDEHPLEQWPKPVWALSIELRGPWPLPTPEVPDSNVWELADRLDGWKLPADALDAQHVIAHGLRAPEDPTARDWPREHGWVACGLRVRAPVGQPAQLALWDVRGRAPLMTQPFPAETTTAYVFLLRVPQLDRCALLRQEGTRWVFERGSEVPEAARAGGFGALALPQLEHGGWIESSVHSVLAEDHPRVRARIENLWLWSGNGKGTLELAQTKDAKERGVGSGSSTAGDAPEFDPWFLQNPLHDWPWPVWSLRVELEPRR